MRYVLSVVRVRPQDNVLCVVRVRLQDNDEDYSILYSTVRVLILREII
jgi:hypothetical protein